MKNSDKSYVYFIVDLKSEAIKIGYADDYYKRLSTLQVGNPNPLRLLHFIECKNSTISENLETEIHKIFDDIRISGEWFVYDEKTKLRFKELFLEELLIERKAKREPLTRSTLFGEETIFDPNKHPPCFFYQELCAQIKHSYEKAANFSIPYRTMVYPTHGKKMLLPFSHELNKVFISDKKHKQILEFNRFEKEQEYIPISEATTILTVEQEPRSTLEVFLNN
jgi:hypothetical protein